MPFNKASFIAVLALIASAGLFAAPSSEAPKGSEGSAIGIFLGQPTGLSFRLGLGNEQSLEAKAAWNLSSKTDSAALIFQANWLLEFPGILVIKDQDLPLYIGAGAQVDVGSNTSLGLRIPGGLIYRFAKAPVELCLELGLGMQLYPATAFVGSGGLGARYRF
jgi:hypothetical protein